MNPRDNQTRYLPDYGYVLPLDLIDSDGRRARFWFRKDEDRTAFADLFNRLHTDYGHTTTAEIVTANG